MRSSPLVPSNALILKIMLTYTTQLLNISPISFIMVRLNEFSNLKRERSSSLMYTILQSVNIKREQTFFFCCTNVKGPNGSYCEDICFRESTETAINVLE